MKVIDLLNDIANNGVNDEIQHIYYFNRISEKNDIFLLCYENLIYKLDYGELDINDKVEILKEEKKIPEKIPEDVFEKYTKTAKIYQVYRLTNEIIDYLESKGE